MGKVCLHKWANHENFLKFWNDALDERYRSTMRSQSETFQERYVTQLLRNSFREYDVGRTAVAVDTLVTRSGPPCFDGVAARDFL